MRKLIGTALLTAALAGCAANDPYQGQRSPQAQQLLASYLNGKVVGGPSVTCLPPYRSNDMIVVDENTILFRDGPNRVYRTEMTGGCIGLGSPGKALVTRSFGSGLCRGEIARVVDNVAGFTTGSCSFGDFVPYVTPGRR